MQRADDTLSRAKNGDQTAFADLLREHQAMVFSLAHYFSRDRATAEDLAQEVFIHLYQNLGSIESPAHLKFWLRRVTSHRCIDHARKHRVKTVSVEDAPEPVAMADFRELGGFRERRNCCRCTAIFEACFVPTSWPNRQATRRRQERHA